ncbi:cytochrome P450 [Trametes elegans]|nr:cytochrome P450 [Trametes elegans]
MSEATSGVLSFSSTTGGFIHQSPLGLALVLFGIYWLTKILRPIDTSRPPRAPYWIPWVGSALELGRDPDSFLRNMANTLGPIFRVKTWGQKRIFVTSPSLISTVYRDSRNFDFQELNTDVGATTFSIDPSVGGQPYMLETYSSALHYALLPSNFQPMTVAFVANTHDCLRSTLANLQGSSVPLASFITAPIYHAAARAAFGSSFPVDDTWSAFTTFDDSYLLLRSGIPRIFLSKPLAAWDKLTQVIESYVAGLQKDGDEVPHYIRAALAGREAGWTSRDVALVLGKQFWALQTNTMWAAYWLVALLLKQPEGLAPLVAEVDSARRRWLAINSTSSLTGFFEDVAHGSPRILPLLTSALEETLRYASQSVSIRRVVNPVRLGGYDLREGELVVCVARQVHMDDEIHPNASTFDIRRYLKTPHPTKDGKLVADHTIPFGGGDSMCIGRHFAMAELKSFMAILLTYGVVEVDPTSSSCPEFAWERIGVGMLKPRGDMQVIIRKRQL